MGVCASLGQLVRMGLLVVVAWRVGNVDFDFVGYLNLSIDEFFDCSHLDDLLEDVFRYFNFDLLLVFFGDLDRL